MSNNCIEELSKLDIASPEAYADGPLHEIWERLRNEAPITKMNVEGYPPFWAITKHSDLMSVLRQPEIFQSSQRTLMLPEGAPPQPMTRAIVSMDPPEHLKYRRLASGYFNPRSVAKLEENIREVTQEIVDECFEMGSVNITNTLACRIPLNAIMRILGVPKEDEDLLMTNTNKLLAGSDAAFQEEGQDSSQTNYEGFMGFAAYFKPKADVWRVEGGDHLAALLSQSEIDGVPINDEELISYFVAIIIAGFDTTRLSITSAMHAFLENPEQWHKLKNNRDLIPSAMEEIFRWSTPITHFARTASQDITFNGHEIKAGDIVAIFHPSANRDAEVFENPYTFDITREPNNHIAFGFGPHLCIGRHLATLEMRILLEIILDQLDFDRMTLEAPIEYLSTNLVGGIRKLQVSFPRCASVSTAAEELEV